MAVYTRPDASRRMRRTRQVNLRTTERLDNQFSFFRHSVRAYLIGCSAAGDR
jgi:hypothetical protein